MGRSAAGKVEDGPRPASSAVSIPPFDALEAGLRIGRALEREGIAYALGGALALGVHGVPRGTLDVDINVFTSDGDLPKVIAVLTALGVDVDAAQASAQHARDGAFVGNWQGMRSDDERVGRWDEIVARYPAP